MRRLRLRLRPSSLLAACICTQLCQARQPGFSVHHDLLAYPQFEVVISDTYISEDAAQALLDSSSSSSSSGLSSDPAHPSYDAGLAAQTDLTSTISAAAAAAGGDDDDVNGAAGAGRDGAVAESYEIMSMPPHRYLCAIPVIEPTPAPNKTATELAMAEEARELARASAHGWDLINELDGTCLHYMSGWWSYRFCYGQEVVQFHAIASSVKSGPPMRDVNTAEYVLGRVPDPHLASRSSRRGQQQHQHNQQHTDSTDPAAAATLAPPNTDLQVKGDQRYLVQRMGDGTICDLTGRERTIEIQYHCSPESTQDRIGWIKEVTTCSYLMMINTPRLCVDVAFQPPKEERANIISCRAIVSESAQADWHARKTLEAQAAMVGRAKEAAKSPIVIGGVVVGGRQMLGQGEDGKEAPQLSPPRNFRSNSGGSGLNKLVEIIASATSKDEGGQVNMMTEEQLQELDLSPETIDNLRKEIQKLAGDRGWQLKMVELPGNNRELVGIIDDDGEDESGAEGQGKTADKIGDGEDENQGSEEKFFKEEL
ncbi:glucosidase II beta subunit-like protein-domain-containing protein [Nemania sp. FL0031]|nr:glucosidase II beta subunit-like protein-domain-containing protein [Nemania sp. FL0031]